MRVSDIGPESTLLTLHNSLLGLDPFNGEVELLEPSLLDAAFNVSDDT